MSLPIVLPPPPSGDAIAATGALLNQLYLGSLDGVERGLVMSMGYVTKNPLHTAAEFWQRQGTNGGALLDHLESFVTFLEATDPSRIPVDLAAAMQTLQRHDDGTVTILQ